MKSFRTGCFIALTTWVGLELMLRHPAFDKRMNGLLTLVSEYRFFANRKAGDRLYPSEKMFDPQFGWRAGPREVQYAPRERVNQDGWRSAIEFKRTKSKTRVLLLGDSFFYGEGLNDEDTVHYQLQKRLGSSYEVMNFAVDGYGWEQMYAVGRNLAFQYSPDWVLIGLINHDLNLERNCLPFAWGKIRKPVYRVSETGIQATNVPLMTPEEALQLHSGFWAKLRDSAIDWGSHSRLARLAAVPVTRHLQHACYEHSVTLLKDLNSRLNLKGKLVVVELDPLSKVFSEGINRLSISRVDLYSRVANAARASGVVLDTLDGYHPGPKTTELQASELSRLIRDPSAAREAIP